MSRPKLYVYVCPYCLKQHRPHVDHNLGMNKRVRCHHAHPGEKGVDEVKVIRIEVVPAEPIELRSIPHDRCPEFLPVEDDAALTRICGKGRETGVCPDHGPTVRELARRQGGGGLSLRKAVEV